jgi:hypothetical protein
MKVIRQTSAQLVLEQRLIGMWLLGAFLAFVGIILTLGFTAPLYFVGALCIAAGSFTEILTPVEICNLDKHNQRLTLIRRRWLRRQIKRYPLEHIRQVNVGQTTYLGTPFYNVCFGLISGEVLTLTWFPTTDQHKQLQTAKQIEAFLSAEQLPALIRKRP